MSNQTKHQVASRPPSTSSGGRRRVLVAAGLLALAITGVAAAAPGPAGEQEQRSGVVRALASVDAVAAHLYPSTTAVPPTTVPPPVDPAPVVPAPEAPPTTVAPPPPPVPEPAPAPEPAPEPEPEPVAAAVPAGSVEEAIYAWFPDVYEEALAVAECESGLNPDAVSSGGGNHGLFQINNVHRARVENMGYSWDQLYDPYVNSHVARVIYDESGWRPWACRP